MAELERLERELLEATQRRDLPRLEELLAPEFTLTTGRPGAEVRSRAEWLEITAASYEIDSFAFEELHVDRYGEAAVVRSRYRQVGRLAGEDRSSTFLMTDVWIRRASLWQIVTRHLTPLPSR